MKYIRTGWVNKVGEEYYITVKVINVETGKSEISIVEIAENKAILRIAVKRLTVEI